MSRDKITWLRQRCQAAEALKTALSVEQQRLVNNDFGYTGAYHNALEELDLAMNFLLAEIRQETFATTGRIVKVIAEEEITPQYTKRLEVIDHVDISTIRHDHHYRTRPSDSAVIKALTENLTGREFGTFTVIGLHAEKSGMWVVQCKCGEYALRKAKAIKRGESISFPCERCLGTCETTSEAPPNRRHAA